MAAIEHQVQQLFCRLAWVGEAKFYFAEHDVTDGDHYVRMNLLNLLLEGSRQNDERKRSPTKR